MKKITYLLVLTMAIFVACGPSAEEKAAEQAKKDSIQAVIDMAKQDSVIKAGKAETVTEQEYDMDQKLTAAEGVKKTAKSTGEVVKTTGVKAKKVVKEAATSTEDAFKKAKAKGAKTIKK